MQYMKLEVWRRSYDMALQICKEVQDCRNYPLKDQISRAAISVPSNIAEGAERQTAREQVRFLYIAKGSCGELVTQIMLARDLGLIAVPKAEPMLTELIEISKMLGGLIKFHSAKISEPEALYEVIDDS